MFLYFFYSGTAVQSSSNKISQGMPINHACHYISLCIVFSANIASVVKYYTWWKYNTPSDSPVNWHLVLFISTTFNDKKIIGNILNALTVDDLTYRILQISLHQIWHQVSWYCYFDKFKQGTNCLAVNVESLMEG